MKWKEHTSTTQFGSAFAAILQHPDNDNDKRAARVEDFFITEALKIGVIKASKRHRNKNPNKLEKQLAPWFSEECRTTRSAYKKTK
jgi:hypothetical protein